MEGLGKEYTLKKVTWSQSVNQMGLEMETGPMFGA